MYVIWDIIDDTVARKVNASDASAFARICGCCPSQVWGVIWTIIAFIFFAIGVIIGLLFFKDSAKEQAAETQHFLPIPGSAALCLSPDKVLLSMSIVLGSVLLGL